MDKLIPVPEVGELLLEEFMDPLGMTAEDLASALEVPLAAVQDILSGRQKITPGISRQLSRVFGMSENFFFALQMDVDRRKRKYGC